MFLIMIFFISNVLTSFLYAVAGFVGMHAVTKEKIDDEKLIKISNIEKYLSSAIIFPILFIIIDNQNILKLSQINENIYWFALLLLLISLVSVFVIILKKISVNVDKKITSYKRKEHIFLYYIIPLTIFFFFFYANQFAVSYFNHSSISIKSVKVAPHFFVRFLLSFLVLITLDIAIYVFIQQTEIGTKSRSISAWTGVARWYRDVFIIPLMIAALDTEEKYSFSFPYFYDVITDFLVVLFAYFLLKKANKKNRSLGTELYLTKFLEVVIMVSATYLFIDYQFQYIAKSICYIKIN